jgi:transposase
MLTFAVSGDPRIHLFRLTSSQNFSRKLKAFVTLLSSRDGVERTFAWFTFYRRLNRDDDLLPETTKTFIYTALSRIMLRRLAS